MRICDSQRETPPPDQCTVDVEVNWYCKIEGRQVSLCRSCDLAWKKAAHQTPALMLRCPNCAHLYFDSRVVPERGHATGSLDGIEMTGPLADAIMRAMSAEGIAGDSRKRVLTRLLADSDPYIQSLLRSVSGVPV